MHGRLIEYRVQDSGGILYMTLTSFVQQQIKMDTFSKVGLIHLHKALLGTCQNPTA